ncbi:MAG: restriction endonuclease subunit S [Taibaiella sp.]|nr:restriction endonuclease subunit S [Taibaiella sp.]
MKTILTEQLKNICTHSKGKKPKRLSTSESELYSIPYINIKAFERGIYDEYTDGNNCNLCEDGDLLMVWDGARAGLTGKAKKGAIGSTLMKIEPKESLNKEYLFYFLKGIYRKLNTNPRGVGIPHVEPTLLWDAELSLPPIPQQQAIVSKLEELFSKLDNGVESLKTLQQQLKVYRQAVLKWAFEGRLTNVNVKDGELPEGWILKKMNEIGSWRGGGTPSKSRSDFWEQGTILWVSPKDMKYQKITDTIDKITIEAVENSSTKLIPSGSVLFVVRSGILRRTLPVALTTCEVTVNQDIQGFTPVDVMPEYVYLYVLAQNDDIRKKCSKDGTTVESIESNLLKNYPIPVCSLKDQQLIVQETESRLSVCDKIEETITNGLKEAEALRQSILKQAFEGKLV